MLILPIKTPATLYRPDSLAEPLEKLLEEQHSSVPTGVQVVFEPVPPVPERIHLPGLIIGDGSPLPPAYRDYSPVPVIPYTAEEAPPPLLRLLSIAIMGKETADFRLIGSWTYRQQGQEFLAIAVAA